MTEEITKAIARAVHEEFGDEYAIYSEAIPQNLQTPCFFIFGAKHESRLQRPGRYRRENFYTVQYIPKNNEMPRAECESAAERLFLCLELLVLPNGLLRGTGMEYRVEDGILHFFVHYDFFVSRFTQQIPMEELYQKSNVKQ